MVYEFEIWLILWIWERDVGVLCDRCKKNAASVHVEQAINNEKTTYNLCMECAAQMEMKLDLSSFFGSLLGDAFSIGEKISESSAVCKSCGLTFSEFQRTGRFGCRECYDSFEPQTGVMLKNIQGSNIHNGKIPGKNHAELSYAREMENLKKQLSEAIEKEEFEDAARLRDKIRSLGPALHE